MTAHPRLSLNQATIKRADLRTTLEVCQENGIRSVGLWREPVHEVGLTEAARMLADSGLRMSSLCRGGFFTVPEGLTRRKALDDNRRAIAETAKLADAGAPGSAAVLVLVPGGLPDRDRGLAEARGRVGEALAELEGEAAACGVTLAVEPMHPMYAADRGVISTLGQALDLAEQFAAVGVVVDTFHVWWDPELTQQIERAGRGNRTASFQVNDWITPLPADSLLARGMMGDGHIALGALTTLMQNSGYRGDIEVEIFNQQIWDAAPASVVRNVVRAFADHILD